MSEVLLQVHDATSGALVPALPLASDHGLAAHFDGHGSPLPQRKRGREREREGESAHERESARAQERERGLETATLDVTAQDSSQARNTQLSFEIPATKITPQMLSSFRIFVHII